MAAPAMTPASTPALTSAQTAFPGEFGRVAVVH